MRPLGSFMPRGTGPRAWPHGYGLVLLLTAVGHAPRTLSSYCRDAQCGSSSPMGWLSRLWLWRRGCALATAFGDTVLKAGMGRPGLGRLRRQRPARLCRLCRSCRVTEWRRQPSGGGPALPRLSSPVPDCRSIRRSSPSAASSSWSTMPALCHAISQTKAVTELAKLAPALRSGRGPVQGHAATVQHGITSVGGGPH